MAVTGIRREILKGLYDESITTSYESFALYKTDGTAPVSIYGAISGLFVYVESVVTAATLACVVTRDAAGDKPLMPETVAAIQPGMTTSTSGGIVIQIGIEIYDSQEPLYIWIKTNAGTCTVKEIMLTYTV